MTEIIAGVDEVGVGPIAGPVVAAAVILNPDNRVYKLKDSKILTEEQRNILFNRIQQKALAISIGIASVEEIDQLNIYHATMLAMQRAITNLSITPSLVLIDGKNKPRIPFPAETIVKGDQKIKCISAASIIAKVTRDKMMMELDKEYPQYNFINHKGYSTKTHQHLLREHGPCPLHRRSFRIVKETIMKNMK